MVEPTPLPAVQEYDSGTGSESEADERARAMRPPRIQEGVVDRSNLVALQEGENRREFGDMTGYGVTGVGMHINVGSKNAHAKLTPEKAQQIRTEYWANPPEEGGIEKRRKELGKKYNVTRGAIVGVLDRNTWAGDDELYPLVEGEPEWMLFMPMRTEREVMNRAKKDELQARKGGQVGLTDAPIIAQRRKKAEKKKVEKE